MSLILDALRKSDRQRQRAAADRLREGPRPARRSSAVSWLAGIAVLLAAGTALATLTRTLLPAEQPPAPSQSDATVTIMENTSIARAEVRGLREELARPAPRETAAAEPGAARPARSTAEPESSAAETVSAAPAAGNQADRRSVAEYPNAILSGLPDMHLDVHAWAEQPEARFVLINLRRYREGDRLEEGPVLRQILPDGVIIEYHDELYSLPRR